ncbi:MAG: hypothetical protein IH892_04245 [Planctomycetes bacterium]|nr:hypothetical protein [Planctomycetota bacterium]
MREIFRTLVLLAAIGVSLGILPEICEADAPEFLVPKNAQWKYYAEKENPPKNWSTAAFDDTQWKTGRAGFGYGDCDDQTVLRNMQGQFTSVHIRRTFDLARDAKVDALFLYLNFDDGFIAYLNGSRVATAFVNQHGTGALRVGSHEAGGYESFEIKDAARILKNGKNVLAIEGHNASVESSDFSLDPFLVDRKLDDEDVLISVDDYLADLDEFEKRLLDQSSYLTRRGFDFEPELEQLRARINKDTKLQHFASGLQKLVMKIGDCHAAVIFRKPELERVFMPFRPADTEAGLAAPRINANEPLVRECPYIESIDGLPTEKWMEAAAKYVPRGSPQFVRQRSLSCLVLSWLGLVNVLRDDLHLPKSETVIIGLRSIDGKKRVQQRQRVTQQGFEIAKVRLQVTRRLDGNIGYIRIPAMENRLVEPIVGYIKEFRDTEGLIFDVRGNSGGTYAILRGIYGFFMPDHAQPYVTNIAAYRLSSRFPSNHIAYRPTYRAKWDGWNDVERDAIAKAAKEFKPEWNPPVGKFSQWHYMVLSRERSGRRGGRLWRVVGRGSPRDYFYYDKPVVVLCNAESFSATDGFLSAFADLPQVTLVGEPSGGGSGATRRFCLSNTQVLVALSSMASFRANGKTFDGNGIEVDVAIKSTLSDYISSDDSVLERGIQVIQEKSK